MATTEPVRVLGGTQGRRAEILSADALSFLAELHRAFDPRRRELLAARAERRARFAAGERPAFLDATREVRAGDWRVAPPPPDLRDRRVEITGPTDRKMVINALNSGARVFMADFEDANSPTWANMVDGQANLFDAVRRQIDFTADDGRAYRLGDAPAVLVVRPRGWHLPERHLLVDGDPVAGSLFDSGLYAFHNARELLARRTGPYLYLPKLESHLEARLWNDVFTFIEERLDLGHGAIRATVLIETIPAAFEMDEILYELRDHSAGLNAGRWDYIFSIIKQLGQDPAFVLPNRSQVTMTVPFMQAYARLLVQTCHRRGAHAMGGMAAFIPNRRDPDATGVALGKVREDKQREASEGFDGTWVAHPDLVDVARAVFDAQLGDRPNQVDRLRDDVTVTMDDLLDVRVPGAAFTTAEFENNAAVAVRYLAAWLAGTGAVAINNLMEDAATAEIARAQLWQWSRFGAQLDDGPARVTPERVRDALRTAAERATADLPAGGAVTAAHAETAREVLEATTGGDTLAEFVTLPAYEHLSPPAAGERP